MRNWMICMRQRLDLTMREMAKRCGCSETLLYYLEMCDSKTLPTLAKQIGIGYGMTLEQANDLAKPLQRRYVMVSGRGGGGYEWCPPKAETVPLISEKLEKPNQEAAEVYQAAARLVQATGKSARQLSVEAGQTGSYVGNILLAVCRGRVMAPKTRQKLAEILGCDEEELKGCGLREGVCLPGMP